MKKFIISLAILTVAFSASACKTTVKNEEPVEKPEIEVKLFESKFDESIIAKSDDLFYGKSKYLEVDLDGDRTSEELHLGRNVAKSKAKVKGNVTTKILVNTANGERQLRESYFEEAYDEYGEMKNGYYIQLTAGDLDGDGCKEIIASIGDNSGRLRTSVFSYNLSSENICEYAGFFISENVASFDGENIVADDTIYKYNAGALYRDDNGVLTQIFDDSFTDVDVKEIEKQEYAEKKKRADTYLTSVRRVLKYATDTTYRYDMEDLSKFISYYMNGTGNYASCIETINKINEKFDGIENLEINEKLLLDEEWQGVLDDVAYCREELAKIKSFLDSGEIMKSFQTAQSSFSNDLYDSCSAFVEKVKNRLNRLD